MGRVLTNLTGFAFAAELTPGVLPASPVWKRIEPNSITTFGAVIKTVARKPISKNRQNRKGTVTDLDSNVAFVADATLDLIGDFFPSFLFSKAHGGTVLHPYSAVASTHKFNVVDVDSPAVDYIKVGSLMYVRGFVNASNNGLKSVATVAAAVAASKVFTVAAGNASDGDTVSINGVVYRFESTPSAINDIQIGGTIILTGTHLAKALNGTGLAGTDYFAGTVSPAAAVTATDNGDGTVTVTARTAGVVGNAIIIAKAGTNISWAGAAVLLSGGVDFYFTVSETLVDESVADSLNATAELAGFKGAATDLSIDSSGNLNSLALDFTTFGIIPGAAIFVGNGVNDSTHSFATAADNGFARVLVVAATKLTLDKQLVPFTTDAGTGKTIYLLFGRFLRNVPIGDADYSEITYQFEGTFPNIGPTLETQYEYAIGNECNNISIDLPLTNKATITYSFVGKDVETFTDSQKTNAANARAPVETSALSTTADIARLRVTKTDATGLTTDFKSLKLDINNQATPEKVLGQLGGKYTNVGIMDVGITASLIFTDPDVIAAIRANTTVTMDFAIQNADGGAFFDIPAMTLGGGALSFPLNQSVLLASTGAAFADPTLNTSIGVSLFPYLPAIGS